MHSLIATLERTQTHSHRKVCVGRCRLTAVVKNDICGTKTPEIAVYLNTHNTLNDVTTIPIGNWTRACTRSRELMRGRFVMCGGDTKGTHTTRGKIQHKNQFYYVHTRRDEQLKLLEKTIRVSRSRKTVLQLIEVVKLNFHKYRRKKQIFWLSLIKYLSA